MGSMLQRLYQGRGQKNLDKLGKVCTVCVFERARKVESYVSENKSQPEILLTAGWIGFQEGPTGQEAQVSVKGCLADWCGTLSL